LLLPHVLLAVFLEVLDQDVVVVHEEVTQLKDWLLVVGLLLNEIPQFLVQTLENGHDLLEELGSIVLVMRKEGNQIC
jgi:hypothetical protein